MVKYKTMLSASSVTWLTANFSAYALLVNTTSMMAKIMKLSSLALGLVVATSGFIALSASAQAATLFFADTNLSLVSDSFEFELLLPSRGNYKSTLFVADSGKGNVQNLFQETSFGDNSGFVSTSNVFSNAWSSGSGIYTLGLSSVNSDNTTKPTVYSSDTIPLQFQQTANVGGWYTFGIEDIKGGGDSDYNDIRFRVRAVPVPAIVPGIALAAAFFGSKALKRNKKVANESVA